MKYLLTLAALAALLLPGCAAMSGGGQPSEEAVAQCRAEADGVVKARYTDRWQAAVDQCLERRAR